MKEVKKKRCLRGYFHSERGLHSVPGEFSAHVWNDRNTWKGLVERTPGTELNLVNCVCERQKLSISNILFKYRFAPKCTWDERTSDQRSMINFVIASSDLRLLIWDTQVKKGQRGQLITTWWGIRFVTHVAGQIYLINQEEPFKLFENVWQKLWCKINLFHT